MHVDETDDGAEPDAIASQLHNHATPRISDGN